MKTPLIIICILILISCNESNEKIVKLQYQVDSLKSQISETYKPGFGEFMTYIQAHHAKLWFAGQNENWQLADFETHEIMETVENIKKYETNRTEAKLIGWISPMLDSVNMSIQQKNLIFFRKSFSSLTNTCNLCHKAAKFGFNVVKIPESQIFSNQDFKPFPQSK
jgi:hypothetical protein